jgi:hypothetical protein
MNVYQKTILLISLMALPLLLLFMKGMGHPHIELVGLAGIALVGGAVRALRGIEPSPRSD